MIALPKTTATVLRVGTIFFLFAQSYLVEAADAPTDRKAEYVKAVGLGTGYLPWQQRGVSEEERQFRDAIELRKDQLLNNRVPVQRPALLTPQEIAQAQKNIETTEWGRKWFASQKQIADYVVAQPDEYVEQMLSELTPMYVYGFTCPHCVGKKSQEAIGTEIARWNHREPDQITCAKCGHTYPSADYPETGQLVCPRSGQTFHYYLNEDERKHPEDRSGRHAWHWVGYPIHVSFSGMIRDRKVGFMMKAVSKLATTYALTQDPSLRPSGDSNSRAIGPLLSQLALPRLLGHGRRLRSDVRRLSRQVARARMETPCLRQRLSGRFDGQRCDAPRLLGSGTHSPEHRHDRPTRQFHPSLRLVV